MIRAGVVNEAGEAKYTGMHSLRHFYASWCINRRVDGGLELPLKLVQARLGHATITLTADRYGHLFPRGDDGAELAAAEQAFLEAERFTATLRDVRIRQFNLARTAEQFFSSTATRSRGRMADEQPDAYGRAGRGG